MAESLPISTIRPFRAAVRPPGSKSLTNRALMLAALGEGRSRLSGVLLADDTIVMIEALRRLGFSLDVNRGGEQVEIDGQGGIICAPEADLMLGNAGTAYRFLCAACCLGSGYYRLDGIERMRQRPVGQLVEVLRRIGGRIDYLGAIGYPPLAVTGTTLGGGELSMSPTLSSQYISALLQVGPCCRNGLTIEFDGPVTSQPYVEMTLTLMSQFGAVALVERHGDALHHITVKPSPYRATDYAVEPDASNASYFLAAAAIVPGSTCTIEGLGRGSLQGDATFADVLHRMGAGLLFGRDFITVKAPSQEEGLRGIDIDLNHMPDMVQTLAVAALFASSRTIIRNVGNLRIKETDRLAALQCELTKLGSAVEIDGDDLIIDPPPDGRIKAAAIDTYNDHRMAMSFAVVGLRAEGVVINEPQCVNKTFPRFFEYLGRLGENPA